MTKYALLVGSYFTRPAPILLQCLPGGTRVELRPEPENPYDQFAVLVVLTDLSQLNKEELEKREEELAGSGWSSFEVLAQSELRLGHVAAVGGKPLEKAKKAAPGEIATNRDVLASEARKGRLTFVGENIWVELL